MKVFLTGGTGFIGSRVAKALIDDGHQVTDCPEGRGRI